MNRFSGGQVRRLAGTTAVVMLLLTAVGFASASGFTPAAMREHVTGSYTYQGLTYHYRAFAPQNRAAHPALLVVVHGCNTTAVEQERANLIDPIARRAGFVVLYVDSSTVNEIQSRCWRAIDAPQAESRSSGDAPAIAGMTRLVAQRYHADRRRIYAIGMSSGAFETAMLGADFPELFAAIGIHSGAAYGHGAPGCVGVYTPTFPTSMLANQAYDAEASSRRVVPVIVFHGDDDGTVPYPCGRQAVAQWRATDNRVLAAQDAAVRIQRRPNRVTTWIANHGTGFRYTVRSWQLPRHPCPVEQFWTIHGMGHYWSGGSSAPASAPYTDPRGPNASAAAWRFFSHILGTHSGFRCA